MARILLLLLAIWVALVVIGWVVKGLVGLAFVGLLIVVGTALLRSSRRR